MPAREYDWERRATSVEAGFWLICLSIVAPLVIGVWLVCPGAIPASRFWLVAVPTFFFSLFFWIPTIVFFANRAFPD